MERPGSAQVPACPCSGVSSGPMSVDWAIRSVKEQRWGHGRHKPRNFTRNRDSLMAPLSRRLLHAALSVGLSLLAVRDGSPSSWACPAPSPATSLLPTTCSPAPRGSRSTPSPRGPGRRVDQGGPAILPTYTFEDVDSAGARQPDVVVVPAVGSPQGARRGRDAGPGSAGRPPRGAHVLGVCNGSSVLAETGLLDGRSGHRPLVSPGCPEAEPSRGPVDGRPAIRPGRPDHHHRRCLPPASRARCGSWRTWPARPKPHESAG